MFDATIHHALDRTQSRRKLRIRLAALVSLPLVLLASGPWGIASWQREAMEDLGLVLVFLAILGRSWSTLYIGGRKVRELVTAGPYSVTRNPLYVSSFLAAAGLGAQTASLTITLVLLLCAYAIFLPVVRDEEKALAALHGGAFERYRQMVPRFLPRPSLWRDVGALCVDPGRWRQTVLDALFFLAFVPVLRGIGWAQVSTLGAPLVRLF
ncbi:isoprenylcysteine carboxylmethyltransferase family protein [Aureimonas sp. AU20]|uniref:methyltransferase family protein n=1 Tax=Aureimonas sp. AU20 TaxID=1349819 RepID=UPI000722897F|nr:isoprenylcysteine carboxylmethyltransferase family protein [Aureimonas sp. AU20]ALN71848.1 hypothetical protein M673_03925 [Aureimonas sp. AU20]